MSFISGLINGAARHLRSEPTAHPVATVAAPAQPQRRMPAIEPLEPLEVIYESFLRKSQLASAASPAVADLIDIIHRDESVQRAAGACSAKHQRLVELAGFRSEIHAAIHVAIAQDGCIDSITPARIAEVLRQRSEHIDDAIADCQEDRARHDAASRTRMLRHEPLRAACSARLTQMVAERASLLRADDAERRANRLGLTGSSRFSELRKAGLTDSQIAEVLPGASSPETVVAHRNERVAELARQIEKLRSFNASPNFDAAHLAGLDGFEDLIVARDGTLPAEVAA